MLLAGDPGSDKEDLMNSFQHLRSFMYGLVMVVDLGDLGYEYSSLFVLT